MLCKRSTKTQRVSHLILDRKYLYSSHHNEGSIRKWDLAANARLAKATADHIPGDLNREALEKLSWRPYDKKILGILLTTERSQLYVWTSYVSLSAKEQAWSCRRSSGWSYFSRREGDDDDDSSAITGFRPHTNVAVHVWVAYLPASLRRTRFYSWGSMPWQLHLLARGKIVTEDLSEGNILLIDVSDAHCMERPQFFHSGASC